MTSAVTRPGGFRQLTRREVLSQSALALSGAALLTSDASWSADTLKSGGASSTKSHFDVLVIGGGLAGLIAARNLGRAGADVLVVEARTRVGGRTYSRPFAGTDTLVDVGGQHLQLPWEPAMSAVVSEYKLQVLTEPAPVFRSLVNGKVVSSSPPTIAIEELGDFDQFYFRIMKAIERIDPTRAIDQQNLRDLDVSYRSFIDDLKLPPKLKAYVEEIAFWCSGAPPESASALEALWWYAIMGNRPSAWLTSQRFKNTTKELVDSLRRDVRGEIRLGTPVAHLDQTEDGVQVITQLGDTLSAKAAVLATPLNTWHDLTFGWDLDDGKRAAIAERHVGGGFEAFMRVKNVPPGIQLSSDVGQLRSAMDYSGSGKNERILMMTFMREWDDSPAFQKSLQSELQQLVPGARILGFDTYSWTKDRYSQGTWAVFRPGQLSRFHSALGRREGRVAFAGADVSTTWFGNMDGALSTGARAADEVLGLLGKQSQT